MFSPPPAAIATTNSYSHAVCRSSELLSCAKTALKVAKAQHVPSTTTTNNATTTTEPPWYHMDPKDLRLALEPRVLLNNNGINSSSVTTTITVCQDALSFLRSMQSTLTTLHSLVRRRGHTNDPTHDIAMATRTMEQDAQELAALVQSLLTTTTTRGVVSTQHARHLELVAAWLQAVAAQQTSSLKQILQLRGTVLAEQAQRRKLLQPSSISSSSNGTATRNGGGGGGGAASKVIKTKPAQAAMNSPLFTMTNNTNKGGMKLLNTSTTARSTTTNGNGTTRSASAAAALPPLLSTPQMTQTNRHGGSSPGYTGGYGGYYGGASYAATGMRQRRSGAPNQSNINNNNKHEDDDDDRRQIQSQIQERQAKRETQSRLEHAKQAESTLAELGTLFGKMTHLISTQGEQLEKLEDDVEAAMGDITAGQEEIQTLYSIKKGNRGLIVKVFGILIFFIVFMKLY
jgi:hypothetical protein